MKTMNSENTGHTFKLRQHTFKNTSDCDGCYMGFLPWNTASLSIVCSAAD